jgi:hypothetical protein
MAEFVKDRPRFFRESSDKVATRNTGAVSHGPRRVLEAVQESVKHRRNELAERLSVYLCSDFGAELRNTVAGSLSHCVIISSRLRDIESADLLGVLADYLPAVITMYDFPGLIGVDLDALSDIVAIHAHSRNEKRVELCTKLIVLPRNVVEGSSGLRGSITYLRPVVSKTLTNYWDEIIAKAPESIYLLRSRVLISQNLG